MCKHSGRLCYTIMSYPVKRELLVDGDREERFVEVCMLQLAQNASSDKDRRALQVHVYPSIISPLKLWGGKRQA